LGNMRKVWVCIAENARWKTGVFSEYIPAILLCIALSLHPNSGHALYVQYKRVSSMFLNVLFYMGKLRIVWFLIAENERWKMDVLSEDIAAILLCRALYLHPKSSHALYVQCIRVSSMFFNDLFYIGNMRKVCVCIVENARWKMGVLSEDIAAILLCIAQYLHPKSSHALYVQYKRVSCIIFYVLFFMGKVRKVCV